MPNPTGKSDAPEAENSEDGINMSSLCRTLARVLVNLDAGEYTQDKQQDTVRQHDALPDQASETAPARRK